MSSADEATFHIRALGARLRTCPRDPALAASIVLLLPRPHEQPLCLERAYSVLRELGVVIGSHLPRFSARLGASHSRMASMIIDLPHPFGVTNYLQFLLFQRSGHSSYFPEVPASNSQDQASGSRTIREQMRLLSRQQSLCVETGTGV